MGEKTGFNPRHPGQTALFPKIIMSFKTAIVLLRPCGDVTLAVGSKPFVEAHGGWE